jgi:hypothetical protein
MTLGKRTAVELDALADALERDDDDVNLAFVTVARTDDLRAVAQAAEGAESSAASLREAVAVARPHGRSWGGSVWRWE